MFWKSKINNAVIATITFFLTCTSPTQAKEAWEGDWAYDKFVCKHPEGSDDPNAGIWTITKKKLSNPQESCEVKRLKRDDEIITMHLKCSMEGEEYNDKRSFFYKGNKLQFISGKVALVRCK